MDKYKKVEELLSNYKMLEVNITNMEDEIKFLDEEDGVSGMDYSGISTSSTNKVNSIVENTALSKSERIEYLKMQIERLKRQMDLVDRTLEGLTETERIILQERYANGLQWWQVAYKAGYSESHSKAIRKGAIKKMIIGIYGEEKSR